MCLNVWKEIFSNLIKDLPLTPIIIINSNIELILGSLSISLPPSFRTAGLVISESARL